MSMDLRQQLLRFRPFNAQEERDRALMLSWLDSGVEIHTRSNAAAHLTASAWVVSPDRGHVLMAYHNLYDSWAWLGGHADGETDLLAVAQREAREESGIQNLRPLMDTPISLEILTVDGHEKRGEYVSGHLHLNVTYLFEGAMEQLLAAKPDENSAVAWIPVDEIAMRSSEPWFVKRIYGKLLEKVRKMT